MTKFLADENLPIKTVYILRRRGINIIPVLEISPGVTHIEVLNLANRQGRVVITFHTDFGRLIFKEKHQVKGIVLLRFVPRSPQHLAERIERLITAEIPVQNTSWWLKRTPCELFPSHNLPLLYHRIVNYSHQTKFGVSFLLPPGNLHLQRYHCPQA